MHNRQSQINSQKKLLSHLKAYLCIVIGIGGVLFQINAIAQTHKDSVSQQPESIRYLMHLLNINAVTAAKVDMIQLNFKSASQSVIHQKGTVESNQRNQINQLVTIRNQQLSGLLTPVQMIKIVPVSDLTTNPDTIRKLRQLQYFTELLGVDMIKAQRIDAIFSTYKKMLIVIAANSQHLPNKQARIDSLLYQKNKELSYFLTKAQISLLLPAKRAARMVPIHLSPKMMAAQDTFERKLRMVLTQPGLSEQDKRIRIGQLTSERKNAINAVAESYPGTKAH